MVSGKNMKIPLLTLLLGTMLLQSCVTGTTAGGADPEAALDNYVQLGLSYLSEGNRDQARQNLLRALEIDSGNKSANNALALLYQVEGEEDLAETHFKKALRADRDFTQARNNYARFLYMQGRFREAREQYQLATEDVHYRLRPQAFIGLALSEKALGNIGETERALQRAISLNPNASAAVLELIQLNYDQKDYVSAKQYLDRYEATRPVTARSLELGRLLAQQFNDARAYETYAEALKETFPNSREARELMLQETQEPN